MTAIKPPITTPTGLVVAGRHVDVDNGFPVHDPATGDVVATVADAGADHARLAARTAAAALPGWSATAPRRRAEILAEAHRLMVARTDELAELISLEAGKARADARAEVGYAAEFFRWFAEEAVRPDGYYGPAPDRRSTTMVASQPIGVALLITPWNFPAAMVTRKVAPALAAGCTAILKPAAETPLTAFAIAAILDQAGAPTDVLTVLPTTRASEVVTTLLEHDSVRKLSFTGSTPVGRHLLRQAADRVLNCSMELGGNAPFVVCPDADLDAAVEGALTAKLRNAGQACTAVNRFFVHVEIADAFTAALATAFATRRVGPPTDPTTDIGPLISERAVRRITKLVDDARDRGASLAHEPADVPAHGSFVAPVVVHGVAEDDPLAVEEIFGPVAPILTWTDTKQMIQAANATEYGLAGYVFSGDTQRAVAIAGALQCGMVGVNRGLVSDPAAPFGGMKQSGLGREGANEGIRAFQETQFLSVAPLTELGQ